MGLLYPIANGNETQQFGPSHLGIEPAAYVSDGGRMAWWQPYKDWSFVLDFHTGLDISAPYGTPVLASEDGVVTECYYDSTNGGGHKVTVEIRPGVRYTSNHMATRKVTLGQRINRGHVIGLVNSSGWSYGNHNHFAVTILESGRAIMYNPKLFLPGGAMAGDPRIVPPTEPPRKVALNGAGINLRTTPDLDRGSANVFATSQDDGIYRNQKRIAKLYYPFEHLGTYRNDDGSWYRVRGLQHILFVRSSLMHDV